MNMKTRISLVILLALALAVPVATLMTAAQTGRGAIAAPPRPQGPCDIYAAAGAPCVAAHSSTRALYASYHGPLYEDRLTPLAKDELTGPRGAGYRRMIEGSVARRAGTPDEVGAVGALLMGPDGGFITGSDFLMDGGVTAAYWYGDVAEVRTQ
jgi:hypothetical protein